VAYKNRIDVQIDAHGGGMNRSYKIVFFVGATNSHIGVTACAAAE
jgi:hypothetical protein